MMGAIGTTAFSVDYIFHQDYLQHIFSALSLSTNRLGPI